MAALRNKQSVVRAPGKAAPAGAGYGLTACVLAMVLAMAAGQAGAQNPNDVRGVGVGFGADPLALAVLERRCPEILADPTWYDDDIIALCLQARRRK